jgi:deazaflavin-dependent oxidoreductase (nitroreductase family)
MLTTSRDSSSASPPVELRQRVGAAIFRLVTPVVSRVIRAALPAGPNVLLTVRGRRSGVPRSTPVAVLELGDARYVQSSFGDVDWVRNLRSSGEAVVTRAGQSRQYRAEELSPEEAGPLLRDALQRFHRSRLLRAMLGPQVRPPAAILHHYHFRIDETPEEYLGEATRHPLFELHAPQDR